MRRKYLAVAIKGIIMCGLSSVPLFAKSGSTLEGDQTVKNPSVSGEQATSAARNQESPVATVHVNGTTETYDARRDDTATKIVVRHDEIIRYGDTNIFEVFKRLPGITVSGDTSRGGEVRMRGLGAGYTQILLDGTQTPAGFSLQSLAPESIERIEILRAATADMSNQSIAGTINVVLRKVVSKPSRSAKLGMSMRREERSPDATINVANKVGKLSYSVNATVTQTHNDRQSLIVEEANTSSGVGALRRKGVNNEDFSFQTLNVAPTLTWSVKPDTTLTWQSVGTATRLRQKSDESYVTSAGLDPDYPFISATRHNPNSSLQTEMNWKSKNETGSQFEARVRVFKSKNDSDALEFGRSEELSKQMLERNVLADVDDRGWGTNGKYSIPVSSGTQTLAIGWDISRTTSKGNRLENIVDGRSVSFGRIEENFDAQVERVAFFAQDEFNLSKKLSLYLGGRWERVSVESTGSEYSTIRNVSQVLSPSIQALWKINDTQKISQIRFALSRTFKAPAPASLMPRRVSDLNNSAAQPDSQGNPELRPELATGFDISFEHYWAKDALFSVGLSSRKITDYVVRTLILDNGRWVVIPVNSGDARSRSLELEAKFPAKSLLESLPDFNVRFNFNRNLSKVGSLLGPDNRIDAQTPLSATFALEMDRPKYAAGATFVYRKGGPAQLSENQRTYVEYRRDIDMFYLWRVRPDQHIRFSIANLLHHNWNSNRQYFDVFGYQRRDVSFRTTTLFRAAYEVTF